MWSNSRTRKAAILLLCLLVVGIVVVESAISSYAAHAASAAPSHSASSTDSVAAKAAVFTVTSIDLSVTPTTTSLWKCGSSIQVVYNAVFHVVSGPHGGTIVFSYTLNNGRSQTSEKLTILPGQRLSNYVFTWQGSLPADHTYPGLGGVLVTSPNSIRSPLVSPAGKCS